MSEHFTTSAPNLEELRQIGKKAGLDDLAVTGVEPLIEARRAIEIQCEQLTPPNC